MKDNNDIDSCRPGTFERIAGSNNFYALRAFEVTFPSPLHIVHTEYAIKLSLKGHGTPIRYRGIEHAPCTIGSVAVFEPFEPLASKASSLTTSFITLFVDPKTVHAASEILRNNANHCSNTVHFRDTALIKEIAGINQSITTGRSLLELEEDVYSVLERVLDLSESAHSPSDNSAAKQVRELILDRLTENVSLEEMQSECRLSRFHLIRMFRKRYGMPPHEFRTHARIARARTLLVQGCSQTEVAQEVGMFDQSHLHRHFTRIMGISPGMFQSQLTK